MPESIYTHGLDKCAANYAALTPLGFLARAATVYPDVVAVIDAPTRLTWAQVYTRCCKLAAALAAAGIGKNHTVSVLAPNSLAAYEAHFAVPMAGAVLNAINTRLDAAAIAFILQHAESRMLLVDAESLELAQAALAKLPTPPQLVVVAAADTPAAATAVDYEALIARGDADYAWQPPADEWDAISLNYTSGTTGNPKGVVYHHRGAYLNALSNVLAWNMPHHPIYLWTLPMFHCNGWCFPWTLAALAGTSVCLRQVTADNIYRAIADYGVTHFCGAPIIMNLLLNATADEKTAFDQRVNMMTAAAPPPAALLAAMEAQGFDVTHVYGLTETYGPAVLCAWHDAWQGLDNAAKASKKSRQGVRYHALEGLDVCDAESMRPVNRNARELGEVMLRGNIVMKGYLKNPEATQQAFRHGWFHSGDLGVMHADNYVQLKDRSKDIIVSGGENISSIEVEDCLYQHPQVVEAAVVAKPDAHWGETPCAFVALTADSDLSEQDIIDHCRAHLAHYKCPRTVVFGQLPKTSTGKVQKFKLREWAEQISDQ